MPACWTAALFLCAQDATGFGVDLLRGHGLYIATSKDGREWKPAATPLADQAASPEILEGEKGKLFIYHVDTTKKPAASEEWVSLITSEDAKTWSKPRRIKVNNKLFDQPVADLSVVRLDDGRFRIYYTTRADAASVEQVHSAVSKDGVEFEREPGVRLEKKGVCHPEVLRIDDTWWMFLQLSNGSGAARSDDGLTFEAVDVGFGGACPAAVEIEGGVRVYTCKDGLASYFWDFKGAPKSEGVCLKPGDGFNIIGEPSCIKRADGTFLMVFRQGLHLRGGTRGPQRGVIAHFRCAKCTGTSDQPGKCCGQDMKRVELEP